MLLQILSISLVLSGLTCADDILERLTKVETLLADMLSRNAILERRVEHLEVENDLLKQAKANLERRNENLEEIDGQLESSGRILPKVDKDYGPDREDTSERNWQRMRSKASKRFVSNFQGSTVAFTAVVSQYQLKNLVPGQTIVYDKTITDIGGAYNNGTGVFTAPVGGAYVFSFAVMVDPGPREYLQLVKNGYHVMWNYIQAPGPTDYVTSSRTGVVELMAGDKVWTRTQQAYNYGTGVIHGYDLTTFAGWLIAVYD